MLMIIMNNERKRGQAGKEKNQGREGVAASHLPAKQYDPA